MLDALHENDAIFFLNLERRFLGQNQDIHSDRICRHENDDHALRAQLATRSENNSSPLTSYQRQQYTFEKFCQYTKRFSEVEFLEATVKVSQFVKSLRKKKEILLSLTNHDIFHSAVWSRRNAGVL